MRKTFVLFQTLLVTFALAACGARIAPAPTATPADSGAQSLQSASQSNFVRVCGAPVPPGQVRCDSLLRTDIVPNISANAAPPGYGPAALRSAYKFSSTAGTGQKIAIVDSMNDPTAESDLNVYRSKYALGACTTANGCFKKVNQNGVQGNYPKTDGGWAAEISLDLDMVSAVCPKCHILLVEANDTNFSSLAAGVNRAVMLGANVVSNSYGGPEIYASYSSFNHPGHIITAAAGDSGTGAEQPCSFSTVVCVGGTTLSHSANARGWSEVAWSGTGSACSSLVAKPVWQRDPSCHHRSETDISAVADPNTGVAVYDTTPYYGTVLGWAVFGGTSASSPVIAAAYGLAGNSASQTYAQSIWKHGGTASFFDVRSGSNGSCAIYYICHAIAGYDGPTGWGTPDGVSGL